MENTYHFKNTLNVAREAVEQGLVPSLCISIGLGNQVFAKACFGKTSILEDATEVNPETQYDMASLTKLMGPTMIALRLISRGELELTDTLPRFFGNDVPEDKRNISVYHLMTHTAGFLPSVRLDQILQDGDAVLPYILHMQLRSIPGTEVAYSCLGYIVLGKVLEMFTGKTLDLLARDEVFKPLGMHSTGYHDLHQEWTKLNTAYTERSSFSDEWLVGKVHDENAYLLNGIAGNAGIFSNLNDCIRFARMISCMGRMDDRVYLPEVILREAMRDHTAWAGNHKGLGFDLTGGWNSICGEFFSDMAAGHTGYTGTTLYINPENGAWIVMLSNRVHPSRENDNMPRIRRTVCNAFAAELSVLNSGTVRNACEDTD